MSSTPSSSSPSPLASAEFASDLARLASSLDRIARAHAESLERTKRAERVARAFERASPASSPSPGEAEARSGRAASSQ